MRIYTEDEINLNFEEISAKIDKGAVFIHPTDTIYGIGCSALNEKAVQKVRKVKNQEKQPFSIIAPSKDWIFSNCVVPIFAEKWLDKLPGPYTLIFRLKNQSAVAPNVVPGASTIGVRMPNHWMTLVVKELGYPIITTSANIHGKEYMTQLDNLDAEIKKNMDLVIYEGDKKGRPSTIIHLDDFEKEEKIVKR